MTPSEFYMNHWMIQTKDGAVHPPQLSEAERKFMDEAIEAGSNTIMYFRKRRRSLNVDVSFLMDEFKKHLSGQSIKIITNDSQQNKD